MQRELQPTGHHARTGSTDTPWTQCKPLNCLNFPHYHMRWSAHTTLYVTVLNITVYCNIINNKHLNYISSSKSFFDLMFIGPCIIVIVEEWKTNLMALAILFHFLCAQHVSDINISIIRSLRLCWWITTSVVLFSVRWVLELLVRLVGFGWCSFYRLKHQPHQISNTQRNENKTTDVVIQQHSRKLLMMGILMSETCWAHNKWNKIASDIKLVFHSSTIAMMHGPINIRAKEVFLLAAVLIQDTGTLECCSVSLNE